ncbi:uncharacterized protein LOC141909080 isoform X2 [Tubulanus polymorphus]|uniref:uncharacterized protein LOC141909080 isoform X2 n=1 Tax=Tubulanus polymorphus TaxID=672921 RepID=UPI003DA58B57
MDSTRREIRKLRKKLRQIEILNRLERDLTDEELTKVLRQSVIREELHQLLANFDENDDDNDDDDDDDVEIENDTNGLYTASAEHNQNMTGYEIQSSDHEESECDDVSDVNSVGNNGKQIDDIQTHTTAEPTGVEDTENEIPWNQVKRRHEKISSSSQSPVNELSVEAKRDESPARDPPKKQIKSDSNQQKQTRNLKKKDLIESSRSKMTKADKEKSVWRKAEFRVRYLLGHNDLIESVVADGSLLVSGSRDTTIKVWDMEIGAEIKSLGGHSGTVSAVIILPNDHTDKFVKEYEIEASDRICISGSSDCSIKIWSLNTGRLLRSVYTYNPVACLRYMSLYGHIVSGLGGGKLEFWDPVSGENVLSVRPHEDTIKCLKVTGSRIVTGCAEGTVKIHEFDGGKSLHLIYESENLKVAPGQTLFISAVKCLTTNENTIFYGDDGVNIKALNWKTGFVTKLRNHSCEFGCTDAVEIVDDKILLSTGFDYDHGVGFMNVRQLPDCCYVATLTDHETERITCLSCTKARSGLDRWVTGGVELKIWENVPATRNKRSDETDVVLMKYTSKFVSAPENSDVDSSSESDAADDGRSSARSSPVDGEPANGWTSWCSVL